MEYNKTKLGDCCEITSSKRCHASERSNVGVPFYCSKEVIQLFNGEQVVVCDYIPEDLYESIKNKYGVPSVGDLLLTTRGTNGIPYIYKENDKFYFADGNLSWFKNFKSDLLDAKYLYYWFQTDYGKHKIDSIAKGTAQKAVPIEGLRCLDIYLPSVENQINVVSILSQYDSLIENCRCQIKLLEEAAQRTYREWFVEMRFPGHESVRMEDGLPEGWRRDIIMNVCLRINAGGTPSRQKKSYWENANVKWFKTQELQDCWLLDSDEKISEEGLCNSSAKIMPKNTVVMAIYASPTLGRLGILSEEACTNQAALGLLADETKISWQYLYEKLYELRDEFNAVAKGAGQQNISAETVKKKEIVIPSYDICKQYKDLVSTLYDKRNILQKQIRFLQQSRDQMLPRLMRGEEC